jgi:4-hydroxythreonine-4-phosphate dehydrogenase
VQDADKPTLALTIGDPAGIGPEVVVKALIDPDIAALADFVIVGDAAVVDAAERACDASLREAGRVRLLDVDALDGHVVTPGRLDVRCGRAAIAYVREAIDLCLRGEAAAMVTAPINKAAVAASGQAFSGHTEFIAERCGAASSRMMLANERLSVVHVSTHIALREACDLTSAEVVRTIVLGHEALVRLGREQPRIAVCGLNPHAGEQGLFGAEDRDVILPAIAEAQSQGLACRGPFAPDTIFLDAWRGAWDLVVVMYHDQGHIPMKLLDFANTVNITLGIPIIRTSVDHGTAFDIAGRGVADPTSMKAAIRFAARLAAGRADSAPLADAAARRGAGGPVQGPPNSAENQGAAAGRAEGAPLPDAAARRGAGGPVQGPPNSAENQGAAEGRAEGAPLQNRQ